LFQQNYLIFALPFQVTKKSASSCCSVFLSIPALTTLEQDACQSPLQTDLSERDSRRSKVHAALNRTKSLRSLIGRPQHLIEPRTAEVPMEQNHSYKFSASH